LSTCPSRQRFAAHDEPCPDSLARIYAWSADRDAEDSGPGRASAILDRVGHGGGARRVGGCENHLIAGEGGGAQAAAVRCAYHRDRVAIRIVIIGEDIEPDDVAF